ncbi:MAG: Na+/H+ antiporter subunit E [Spirochaetales bacterium]|nr:Na+/H+ antiporter subunit E [Spirochaetales bacterium]
MKVKTVLISFCLGLLFWIGLNSSVRKEILITGVLLAILGTAFLVKTDLFGTMKFSPKAIAAMFTWLFVFLFELIKSNIDVMSRVITPKVRINPAVVEVKTKLKSKLGRLALANSITLTPGTLTVDIMEDKLYIHWIDASSTDVEKATEKIVDKFEKHLEVIFG